MKTEPGPGPVSTCHCPESRQEMKACDSPVEFSDLNVCSHSISDCNFQPEFVRKN